MQTIGNQLRQMRMALSMTQVQLAQRCGMAQNAIADIETGKRINLTLPTIEKLAAGLNCEYSVQILPRKDIPQIKEEQSEYLARKIISISSGSSAIEMQLPSESSVQKQIAALKKQLLEKPGSALWQDL